MGSSVQSLGVLFSHPVVNPDSLGYYRGGPRSSEDQTGQHVVGWSTNVARSGALAGNFSTL